MNDINKSIYELSDPLPLDVSGWNGNSIVFAKMIELTNAKIIIEVGTWKGMSAITMAKILKENNKQGMIYCIDTWLGALEFWQGNLSSSLERNLMLKYGYPQIYYQFISNVIHCGLTDYILPFPNTSLIGARFLKNKHVIADLIYIDASHDYEDIILDIKAYWPLLKEGGKIFGDDYKSWPGVSKAVREFAEQNNKTIEFSETEEFWIITK